MMMADDALEATVHSEKCIDKLWRAEKAIQNAINEGLSWAKFPFKDSEYAQISSLCAYMDWVGYHVAISYDRNVVKVSWSKNFKKEK